MNRYSEAIEYLKSRVNRHPRLALTLGSGLGFLADGLRDKEGLAASDIPHYPISTVTGHAGELVFGRLAGGADVLAFKGRIHFYEGYSIHEVVYPVMVAHGLGAKTLIVTNASGSINREFSPGDLMLITDHINFAFEDPRGGKLPSLEDLPRHDAIYDESLIELAEATAAELGVRSRRGVYVNTKGPSYETPAEIEMFRRIGADAVGMSTVPEVLMAHRLGMRIAGISLITNMAAGITEDKLSHSDVGMVAAMAKNSFSKFLMDFMAKL
jgi:purine-nucleoside phosphorylase